MKIPKRLQLLINDGLIDDVIRRLKSGKEADVFIVRCGQEIRCAKVYKEIENRSFKRATQYKEARKVRNSRDARAIGKGSKFGRHKQEKSWHETEIEALLLLSKAEVPAPKPYICLDGVLLMELITDKEEQVAPRLSDITLTPTQARNDHALMMKYVVRMLCSGLVHGDLSEFNILMSHKGPVIIDLPQVVDAAANNQAKSLFERDINNISRYYGQYAPELLSSKYAEEIWARYESGNLTEVTPLSGEFISSYTPPNIDAVLEEICVSRKEYEHRIMMRHQKDSAVDP